MKKFVILSVLFLCMAGWASASALADRPIGVEQLPAAAQKFIRTHFASSELLYAKIDDGLFRNEYKVVLAGGISLEFTDDGEWKEVEAEYGEVPAAIVPEAIRKRVAQQFPNARIESIDRDRRGYDVGLSNGLDLEFDRQFNLVDIDD
ncbi:MAG: PepSY-like domain-containing protein [Alistipes sp.]|nr:PepSY-like domain-containing protein [Alistipes senegalensis]MCM1250863.1 PepSY-like domain-containing protein [Alistipes sp.]